MLFNFQMKTNRLNISSIFQHTLFIITLISLSYFFDPRPEFVKQNSAYTDEYYLLRIALIFLTGFYTNMFVLVPQFLVKKGWGYYTFSILILCLLVLISNNVLMNLSLLDTNRIERPPLGGPPLFLFFLLVAVFISTSLRLNKDRVKNEQLRKERENESLKSELSLLRSQITPHFMFNVLNTLASLARQKSDELEDVIIRISQLMRYMLYNKADNKITLEQEIEFLNSYIEIQKLRFGSHIKITTSFQITDVAICIEPMLIIPLIENAFKHGTGTVLEPLIDIQFTDENNVLDFVITNRFNPDIAPKKDSSGIGIINVKKRLSFLYEDKHELNTFTEKDTFTASLKLIL